MRAIRGIVGLLGHRRERLVERHAGLREGRQLAGGERHLFRCDTHARERVAAIGRASAIAVGVSPSARSRSRAARARLGVEQACRMRPCASTASQRNADMATHYCSRVTRTSSASDVVPSASKRAPSARSVRIPARVAASRSAISPAPSWISRRIVSSTTSSSYTPVRPR